MSTSKSGHPRSRSLLAAAVIGVVLCGPLSTFAQGLADLRTGVFPDNQRLKAEPASSKSLLAAIRLSGKEVESIRDIETLSDWTTLDTRHLTLKVNHSQQYLLTLQDHCEHLRGAQLVGVSMSNQEIWADFDHVAADGYECRIDRITQVQ